MQRNSSDYFAYKRSKFQSAISREETKPISKFNFLIQLFIATFVIIFISIVFMIMKYSQKIDIEYSKGDLLQDNFNSNNSASSYNIQDDEQKKIDKRLILIQQEENAPSEARILKDDTHGNSIIDPKHLEQNKKIEKEEKKIQEREISKDTTKELDKPSLKGLIEDLKSNSKQNDTSEHINSNITIMSKVLIGKYATFEEAQVMQNTIKTSNPKLAPYVRKVGEVYAVQMGSYQDFNIAKTQAHNLKAKGYEVWIYQQ